MTARAYQALFPPACSAELEAMLAAKPRVEIATPDGPLKLAAEPWLADGHGLRAHWTGELVGYSNTQDDSCYYRLFTEQGDTSVEVHAADQDPDLLARAAATMSAWAAAQEELAALADAQLTWAVEVALFALAEAEATGVPLRLFGATFDPGVPALLAQTRHRLSCQQVALAITDPAAAAFAKKQAATWTGTPAELAETAHAVAVA